MELGWAERVIVGAVLEVVVQAVLVAQHVLDVLAVQGQRLVRIVRHVLAVRAVLVMRAVLVVRPVRAAVGERRAVLALRGQGGRAGTVRLATPFVRSQRVERIVGRAVGCRPLGHVSQHLSDAAVRPPVPCATPLSGIGVNVASIRALWVDLGGQSSERVKGTRPF